MPFFWFGGETTSSTAADGQAKSSSVAISSHHARKSSLSLSASSGQNVRLAEVRSEATASYLQHQSIDMGGNHRRTQSGDISRRSRTSTGSGHGRKRGGVVAIEDDDDSKHKGRIDQGLIDACNEAKVSPTKASWWTSFSVTAITPSSFPDDTTSNVTASKLAPPNINEAALKHRRTVSKTTYRV